MMPNRAGSTLAITVLLAFAVIAGLIGCKQGTQSSGSFIDRATNITTGTSSGGTGGAAPTILGGRVVDAVTGLGVNAFTVKTEGNQVTTTKNNGIRDGIFSIVNAPLGTYKVFASKSNYETADKEVTIAAANAGKTVDMGDLVVYPLGAANAGTIKGQVKDTADSLGENGVRIQLESGISTITANDGVRDGAYIINNSPVGTYTISASKAGFTSKTESITVGRLQTVTKDMLISTTSESGGGPVVTNTRSITGQVIEKKNLLGLDGVQVRTEGGLVATTANDGIRSGMFTIQNAPVSTYNLFFSKTGYNDGRKRIEVKSGTGLQEITGISLEAVAKETGTIKGQVTIAGTNTGLNDVTVTLEGGLSVITSNNGVVNGAYLFERTAPVGTYTITFQRSGYLTKTSDPLTVSPDQTTILNFALSKSQSDPDKATIRGRVEDISIEDKPAAPGQKVYIYVQDSAGVPIKINGATVDTYTVYNVTNPEENGTFTLINVPPGTYTLVAALKNYQSGTMDNISVTAGQVLQDGILLQIKGILGSITGVIYQDQNDNDKFDGVPIDFPLRNATVEIDGTQLRAITRINGTYTISNVKIGNDYIIVAGASVEGRGRYIKSYRDGIDISPDAPNVTGVDIALSPASTLAGVGHVEGYIKDIYGNPLENATVEIDPGGANQKANSTQGDGFFFIRDITAGTYILRAAKASYSTKTKTVKIPADQSSADAGTIKLQPNTATISGIVYNDVNSNKAYEVGTDLPIDKSTLKVEFGGPDLAGVANGESANNGVYNLYGVPYGKRVIYVSHPSYSDAQLELTVGSAVISSQNIPMLSKIGYVTGEVFIDTNGNGTKDLAETVLASASVTLKDIKDLTGATSEKYTTGTDGVFVFRNVPIGNYTINAIKTAYGSNSRFVEISPNGSKPSSPVYLGLNNKYASIAGSIVELKTDGTNGASIGGATVEVQGLGSQFRTKSSYGAGDFLISGLTAKDDGTTNYTVQAYSTTYEANSVALLPNYPIKPGETTSGITIALRRKTGSIAGIVKDSGGAPITGASVVLAGSGQPAFVTQSDGSYTFTGVPISSNYQLEVTATGYSKDQALGVIVKANQQSSKDFTLTLGSGSITGKVVENAGTTQTVLSGVSVEIIGTTLESTTGSNGFYKITAVPQGTHTVIAYSSKYSAKTQDVIVAAGKLTNVTDIVLDRLTGHIRGRVVNDDLAKPAPLANVSVRIVNTNHSTVTAADGTYSIDNILIGKYRVESYQALYGTQGQTVEITANQYVTRDFTLSKARGSMAGIVVETTSGEPLTGMTVEISGTSFKTKTVTSGTYLITGIPSNTNGYTVIAYGASYESGVQTAIKVSGEETTTVPNITLNVKKGTIAGVIRKAADGNPLSNAYIAVSGINALYTSDDQGAYNITGIPITPSSLRVVTAGATNYMGTTKEAKIYAGQTVTLDFSLSANIGNIGGRVTDSTNGSAVNPASVRIKNTLFASGTDTEGYYLFTNVPTSLGTVAIEVVSTGYNASSESTLVQSGATKTVNISMDPTFASIAGRITDSTTNLGVENVTVRIIEANMSTPTDFDGFYVLKDVPEKVIGKSIEAIKAGYTSYDRAIATVVAGKTEIIDFVLTATTGMIVGTVYDSISGIGLTSAVVRISGSSLWTTTDPNGAYNISNVKIGAVTVQATSSGYSPQTKNDNVSSSSATIVDFPMVITTGSVAGQVSDIVTGNGIQNAFVRVTGSISSASTDAFGIYQILNVPANANAEISAQANGYKGYSQVGFNIQEGSTLTANIQLTPTSGTVTGIIVDASTGAAIDGAVVAVSGTSSTQLSDSSGQFKFEKIVPAGVTIEVEAQAPNYLAGKKTNLIVEPGKAISVNFQLTALLGSLAGKVTDAFSTQGLPNVTVIVSGVQTIASTLSNGNFVINNIPAGAVRVEAAIANYKEYKNPAVTVVGGEVTSLNFTMTPVYGTISGLVTNVSKVGLNGSLVQLKGTNITAATTNTSGYYVFNAVPAEKTYTVVASISGYQNNEQATGATLEAGKTQNVDLILTSLYGTITGLITDEETGNILDKVKISIPSAGIFRDAKEDGSFLFTDVPASSSGYTVEAIMVGYTSNTAVTGTLTGGSTVNVAIKLRASSGTITGTVRNKVTQAPLEGVTIVFPGSGLASLQTGAGGLYSVASVPEAAAGLSVEASLENYLTYTGTTGPVAPGDVVKYSFFMEPASGTILGTVVNSVTDQPMSGVQVAVIGSGVAADTTGDAGDFTFENVPAGSTYEIQASAGEGFKIASAESATVLGGSSVYVAIRVTPLSGTITGTITNVFGITPEASAFVSITGVDLLPQTTDGAGQFTFAGVPVTATGGTGYDLVVTKKNYTSETKASGVVLDGKTTTVDFAITPLFKITGTVFDSKTGQILPNASIDLVHGSYSNSQVSNSTTGVYTFSDIPCDRSATSSKAILSAVAANYRTISNTITLGSISVGKTLSLPIYMTSNSGAITGTIKDTVRNTPITGVAISLSGSGDAPVNSDDSGEYYLDGLPIKQSIKINFTAANYASRAVTLTIDDNLDRTLNVGMSPRTATLAGTVRDAVTGFYLQDATITSTVPLVDATTRADGKFTNANPIALNTDTTEAATLTVYLANYSKLTKTQNLVRGTDVDTGALYLTPLRGSITGFVYDKPSENPLVGVGVTLEGTDYKALTKAGGVFTITNVPVRSGDYYITAYKQKYQKYNSRDTGTTVEVTPGLVNAIANPILLVPNFGAITGYVYDIETNQGVNGASLTLPSIYGVAASPSGGTGFYRIDSVPIIDSGANGVTVSVTHDDYFPEEFRVTITTGGQVLSGQNANLRRTSASISGVVTDTVSGVGVVGVTVSVSGVEDPEITDSSGKYIFADIPVIKTGSNFTVTAAKTLYSASVPASVAVNALKGGQVGTADFTMEQIYGSISGVVTESGSGTAISGAKVRITNLTLPRVETDANGVFTIDNVPVTGQDPVTGWKMEVTEISHTTITNADSGLIVGGVETIKDFEMITKKGTISGIVTSAATGLAVDTVVVTVRGSTTLTDTTGTDGVFTIPDVPEGTVKIEAIKAGFSYYISPDIAVTAGGVIDANIALSSLTATVKGVVKNSVTGALLTDVAIAVPGTEITVDPTEANGYYVINELPVSFAGDIYYSLAGYVGQTVPVAGLGLTPGASVTKDIDLVPVNGAVNVLVRDSKTQAFLPGVTVVLENSTIPPDVTGTAGTFGFSDVPSGPAYNYQVTCSLSGYITQTAPGVAFNLGSGESKLIVVDLIHNVGVIYGMVTDSVSGNPLDANLYSDDSTVEDETATGGYYEFSEHTAGGTPTITATFTDYIMKTQPLGAVLNPGTAVELNFALDPAIGTVMGYVVDELGSPVDGARVTLLNLKARDNSDLEDTTEADGSYSILNVPMNKIIGSIQGVEQNHQSTINNDLALATLSAATPSRSATIVLSRLYGTLSGTVRDGVSGAAISGALVSVSGNNHLHTATTDAAGAYTISKIVANVDYDPYDVTASKGVQFLMRETDQKISVRIVAGETVTAAINLYANIFTNFRVFGTVHVNDEGDGGGGPYYPATPNNGIPMPAGMEEGWTVRVGTGYESVMGSGGNFMVYLAQLDMGAGTVIDDPYRLWVEAVYTHPETGITYSTGEFFRVNATSNECNINDLGDLPMPVNIKPQPQAPWGILLPRAATLTAVGWDATAGHDLSPPALPGVATLTLTPGAAGSGQITVQWNKGTDNITTAANLKFRVYYSTANNLTSVAAIEANGTPFGVYQKYAGDPAIKTVTGLTLGTPYYFNVIMTDAAGYKTPYTMGGPSTPAP